MKYRGRPVAVGASAGRWARVLAVLVIGYSLLGCATGPNANPRDPLEPFNRGVFEFNDAVDNAIFKPVATTYREVTPVRVRQGIGNFFGNLEDLWSFVNNALQFKAGPALDSLRRFGVNTFFGWVGVVDVASGMDIEKHTKDFGHTLGYWGISSGPYLVLPLLGPSSLRDTAALPIDSMGDLVANVNHVPTRNAASVLRIIDTRSSLLKASAMLEEAALDRYSFVRDAYLARRRSVIFEGNPPEDDRALTGAAAPAAAWPAEPSLADAALMQPHYFDPNGDQKDPP